MPIERRAFLKYATLGCACCVASKFTGFAGDAAAEQAAAHAAAGGHAKPHWSYDGQSGPEHWGELSPDFKVCQLGLEQTPIDLAGATTGDPGGIAFDYRELPLRLERVQLRRKHILHS